MNAAGRGWRGEGGIPKTGYVIPFMLLPFLIKLSALFLAQFLIDFDDNRFIALSFRMVETLRISGADTGAPIAIAISASVSRRQALTWCDTTSVCAVQASTAATKSEAAGERKRCINRMVRG